MDNIFKGHRKSHISLNNIYFWTATIRNWEKLLNNDDQKQLIIDSLLWLKEKGCIDVYGFVIMPNHLHLLWQVLKNNGRESPQGSLLKYTAHCFRRHLLKNDPLWLRNFAVNAVNKEHEFWQRDSLAVNIFSSHVAFQKLDYMHCNPLDKHWNLAPSPEKYRYSSAAFYELGIDEFGLLTNIQDVL